MSNLLRGVALTSCIGGISQDIPMTTDDLKQPKWQVDLETGESYAMVVVACTTEHRERHGVGLGWLADVPSTWTVFVYEKCAPKEVHQNSSFVLRPNIHFRSVENIGSEECTAYLDYIMNFYQDLPDVSIFMQDDALISHSVDGRNLDNFDNGYPHTPFHNMSQLEVNTKRFLAGGRGFLHYGVRAWEEPPLLDVYFGKALFSLWPLLASPRIPSPGKSFTYVPGACFAVRRKRILQRPLGVYDALHRHVYYSRHLVMNAEMGEPKFARENASIGDERMHCCVLEKMWAVLFGETPLLPNSSMVAYHMNLTIY